MRLLLRTVIIAALASTLCTASPALVVAEHHAKHAPTGWQPGGPLRPIYQAAVKAIHDRDFDKAEALCQKGLALAKGDKAFTDLTTQIPQWKHDTEQADITRR